MLKRLFKRPPDLCVGGESDPYLKRWRIVRTPLFGIYPHKFERSDDPRALHDHPWPSVSLVLKDGAQNFAVLRHARARRSGMDSLLYRAARTRMGIPLPERLAPLARIHRRTQGRNNRQGMRLNETVLHD